MIPRIAAALVYIASLFCESERRRKEYPHFRMQKALSTLLPSIKPLRIFSYALPNMSDSDGDKDPGGDKEPDDGDDTPEEKYAKVVIMSGQSNMLGFKCMKNKSGLSNKTVRNYATAQFTQQSILIIKH